MKNTVAKTRRSLDYLRAIYLLEKNNGVVRGVDIAKHFGVSKPTVSTRLKAMENEGYIKRFHDHSVALTDMGRRIAGNISDRNDSIYQLLIKLGVDDETAFEDACNIEQVISTKSFTALIKLAE